MHDLDRPPLHFVLTSAKFPMDESCFTLLPWFAVTVFCSTAVSSSFRRCKITGYKCTIEHRWRMMPDPTAT